MTALIIDGNHLAHRCRHAYQLSWQGIDTSVTYGFVRVLMSYLKQYQPEIVIVAWDAGVPIWRKETVKSYKANRHHDQDQTYPDFIAQIDELRQILPAFGVVQAWRKGIEADDLAYHASRMLDVGSIIVSGDADLLQAVNTSTSVLKPGKVDTLITLENFESVVGVPRRNYEWYRALQGDNSDNLRGCQGLGPKTAQKIIAAANDPYDMTQLVEAAPKKLRSSLEQYITSGQYEAVLSVMYLHFDKVGARAVLYSTDWQRYDKMRVQRWCLDWGFASLVQAGSMGAMFGRLHPPRWQNLAQQIPMIWSYYRDPLQE